MLMRVSNPTARAFYEIEAVRESWSTRELERQIGSLLFERLAKSRDKEQVLARAREGQKVATQEAEETLAVGGELVAEAR
jgi:predicted nuclease of restriction endonuclease-like (RecB) superfamily